MEKKISKDYSIYLEKFILLKGYLLADNLKYSSLYNELNHIHNINNCYYRTFYQNTELFNEHKDIIFEILSSNNFYKKINFNDFKYDDFKKIIVGNLYTTNSPISIWFGFPNNEKPDQWYSSDETLFEALDNLNIIKMFDEYEQIYNNEV